MFSRYFPSEAIATLKRLGQIRRNRVIMVTVPALLTFLIPAFTNGYSLAMADGSTFGITNDYPLDNWLSFIAAGDHFLRTVVANVH
jgi:hypothetical protein